MSSPSLPALSPLDAKLLRDLWRMKGQAGAIAAVMGVGVLLIVMMTGLVASLTETRAAYYERYRLADVFAPVSRAPARLEGRLAAIPGVAAAEGRVTGRALIDLAGQAMPVQARAVSLPDGRRPALNDVLLTAGRLPDPAHKEEVALLDSFAGAHALRPGDTLDATMNGARRTFRIVGLARSPEFLYTTAPGEMVPDDSRFGVLWLSRAALAAAYDMEGAFNEALVALARGAEAQAVEAEIDRLLAPWGGTGAYGLDEHPSDIFVSEEIKGLKQTTWGVPPILLGVSAFLLTIVMGRMIQSEREEIGLLKAFGYTNGEVAGHYLKMILVIALAGALAGCLFGIAGGRAMTGIYTQFFKFPFLVFRLDPSAFVLGVAASVAAAGAGGLVVLRRVVALTPAEAMRPPAPADYSRSGRIWAALARRLDQPSRMVLRRLTRQPVRMGGAVVGIASGMAISVAMLTIFAGFDRTVKTIFSRIDRSDMAVTFTHAVGERTLHDLARLPGVRRTEAIRHVPVILSRGTRTHRGAITGLPESPALNRALGADGSPLEMPDAGLVLSTALAEKLGVAAGETVVADIREGRQPTLEIPVAAIAEVMMGTPAYMNLGALNTLLREPGRVSGAHLAIDTRLSDPLAVALTDRPAVAGVSLKADAEAAFQRMLDTGAGSVRYVMGGIAFVMTFGIVYNAARIAYAERARDLAGLRVLGFTRGEAAYVLLGELAVVTLVALPIGAVMGYGLAFLVAAGFSSEIYQIEAFFDPASHGSAALVVLSAAVASGWLVKRDMDRADLIAVLKTRE